MRIPLSKARIVEAALAIVDEHGLAGLSMRKIAGKLDVEAMSLYRHVKNKAALLDALHDTLVGGVTVPADGSWKDRVRQTAHGFRNVMARHPRLVPLLTRPATTPRALGVLDDGVRVLTSAGFSEGDALVAFQTVFCFVVGHGVFHMADGQPPDAWADEEFAGGLEILLRGLIP